MLYLKMLSLQMSSLGVIYTSTSLMDYKDRFDLMVDIVYSEYSLQIYKIPH